MTFAKINQRDQDILDWQAAKAELDAAIVKEMALRKKVFADNFPNAEVGTNNLELGRGYILKAVRKINYNLANGGGETDKALDAIEKLGNRGAYIADDLVSWKPNLSLTTYKKLDETDPQDMAIKKLIDAVITTSDGAPTLEVVVPKA